MRNVLANASALPAARLVGRVRRSALAEAVSMGPFQGGRWRLRGTRSAMEGHFGTHSTQIKHWTESLRGQSAPHLPERRFMAKFRISDHRHASRRIARLDPGCLEPEPSTRYRSESTRINANRKGLANRRFSESLNHSFEAFVKRPACCVNLNVCLTVKHLAFGENPL